MDNVPLWLQPIYLFYGYGLGFLYFFYIHLVHFTSKIEIKNRELLNNVPSIHCLWHRDAWIYFCSFIYKEHVWLTHPYWYMKPTHVAFNLCGLKAWVFGSTGNDGRKAADEIVKYLREGSSTWISPDGPAGPPQQLRKGVLHISAQSSAPILPMRFKIKKYIRLWGWDKMLMPLPFARIEIEIRMPIEVTENNIEEARALLIESLGS
ncbi:MAG: hypothetical protein JWQ35_128 [Bacteriovoracaceae bacterium]|nr:hypothetical protein [Bacteriovoracaceae bacterium]